MDRLKVKLCNVLVGDDSHTILETPDHLPEGIGGQASLSDTFNLAMIDVSGSMYEYWSTILNSWNKLIAPVLKGETKIFVFGSDVHFRRTDVTLEDEDMLNEGTNLTEAIKVINSEIHDAKQTFVRLFLITDGDHNATSISPEVEIAKLYVSKNKTVEVFLLGIGTSFPVEYSITIRSLLHNGNANIPSLFWAKYDSVDDFNVNYGSECYANSSVGSEQSIIDQFLSMEEILRRGFVKLNLSPPGYLVPGCPPTEVTHLGEFVYFPFSATELKSRIKLSTENAASSLEIDASIEDSNLSLFLDHVFRQWNSLLIQQHRNKEPVSMEAFQVMEKIFTFLMSKMVSETENQEVNSIFARLHRKKLKSYQTEFETLMNQGKTIIGIEGKYESEIELAKTILKTTVKSKYDVKNLKMKGYGMKDYAEDLKKFIEVYEESKEKIMALPEPSVDDSCRVTLGSFVKDLQDPSFLALLQEDKFTLMKTLTVTGLPIYAPVKDSSQINVWTLHIKNILKSPYTIISQNTLELSAEVDSRKMTSENKEVYLQEGDENTKFNAIIPVFSPEVAIILKKLVRTNIFAMLSTFCILKNPHIIDHNAHIAALACAWVKTITDYPNSNRPEFVTRQISLLEATGNLYIDRGGIARYLTALLSQPRTALITEFTQPDLDTPSLKCESLAKPAFLLYLARNRATTAFVVKEVLPFLITEFVGRCLQSNIDGIYGRTFVKEFKTKKMHDEWRHKKLESSCTEIMSGFIKEKGNILETYYHADSFTNDLKLFSSEWLKHPKCLYDIGINMTLMNELENVSSAGILNLGSIRALAQELNVSDLDINETFSEKQMLVYAIHALRTNSSRERMTKDLPDFDVALQQVKKEVDQENMSTLKRDFQRKVLEEGQRIWTSDFLSIHDNVLVRPLLPAEIVDAATHFGVQVTLDSFSEVYKYNPETGLIRNGCMIERCPYYLQPRNTYNMHAATERRDGFPHQLHKVTREVALEDGNVDNVIEDLLKKKRLYTLKKRRKKESIKKTPLDPSVETLNTLRKQIEDLIIAYKQLISATKSTD